jgi:hypothetical protein
MELHGSYIVKYNPEGPGTEKEYTMDFTPPFKRVSMMSGLEEVLVCMHACFPPCVAHRPGIPLLDV